MTIEWESSDSDISAHFKQASDPTGNPVDNREAPTSPIPWRFHRLDRKNTKNKWTSSVDRTVYRFYGDLRSTGSDTDYPEIAVDNVFSRRQLMLSLWNDIGPVPGDLVPWYLRDMPVKGFGPLSLAFGYLRNGRKDQYMVTGEGEGKWHPVLGVRPLKMYWVSAHVTRYVSDEKGELQKIEAPMILLLKEWQARAIADTLSTMREMKGADWDITGFPFHILNLTLKQRTDTAIKMTPAGQFNAEDKEIFDMSSLPAPNFREQGVALVTALDEFLVAQGHPLKDFPMPGAHATDGWTTVKPLAQIQFEESQQDAAPAADKYKDRSIEELRVLADEYGVTIRKNASREKIIEAIEDSVPF